MGVRGLLKFLQDQGPSTGHLTDVPLEEGTVLAVDASGFVFHLIQNPGVIPLNIRLSCGYYDVIDFLIRREIAELQEYNLRLVFFMDGMSSDLKSSTSEKRFMQRMEDWDFLSQVLENPSLRRTLDIEKKLPLPAMMMAQLECTLRSLEVELVECTSEADQQMAMFCSRLNESKSSACAFVYAQDSDFLLMKDCELILFGEIYRSGADLMAARVWRRSLIAQSLNMTEDKVVDMCILVGNDYSSEVSFQASNPTLPRTRKIAGIYEFLCENPHFSLESSDPETALVISYCRDLYNLADVSSYEETETDEISERKVLEDKWACVSLTSVQKEFLQAVNIVKECEDTRATNLSTHLGKVALNIFRRDAGELFPRPNEIQLEALKLMLLKLERSDNDSTSLTELDIEVPHWEDVYMGQVFQLICKYLGYQFPVFQSYCPSMLFNATAFHKIVACLRSSDDTAAEGDDIDLEGLQEPEENLEPPTGLPIDNYQQEILDLISRDRVSIIHG